LYVALIVSKFPAGIIIAAATPRKPNFSDVAIINYDFQFQVPGSGPPPIDHAGVSTKAGFRARSGDGPDPHCQKAKAVKFSTCGSSGFDQCVEPRPIGELTAFAELQPKVFQSKRLDGRSRPGNKMV